MWLAEGETAAMARELSMSEEHFVARFVRRSGERLSLREVSTSGSGDRCALLTGANTCSVYASRPAQCRNFPYWPSVLDDAAAFESARATCPGIAVVVPRAIRERAFARLAELYAEVDHSCDSESNRADEGEAFVTGLEADFWAAQRTVSREPLAYRTRQCTRPVADAFFARLRAIERETGYPASYGRLDEMMHVREQAECAS